jgi:membrane fusion protein (multidrug efflux system)
VTTGAANHYRHGTIGDGVKGFDMRFQSAGALITALALAVGTGLTSGCSHADSTTAVKPAAAPTEVRVTHLARAPMTRSITLPAQVIADQQATLYAKVSGYLKTITVDKGDKVAAGAVLARIEMPELVASRSKQQAELKAAAAEYTRMQESLQKAPDLVVPAMVDQARGRFEIAQANLEQSETLLRYATITAPFAGIITQRFVDPGALIQVGSSSAALLTLMDFRKVRLQVAVPEVEASRVAVGQPVLVTTENLPGKHFEGKIARYTYALDTSSRTMLAEVILDNPALDLRPGMLVTAKLGIERKDNASVVPVDALVMEKSNAFVYAIEQGKAAKHQVKVGINDGGHVEVLEGMPDAAEVILVGKLKLSNGQAVTRASVQ